MRLTHFVCLLALGFVSNTYACLWDRDTVADEAKGVPDAVDIIAGRFERNPPLYFQMRRDRVLALLNREPSNLDAYDDAAVACDRLGDDDKAIDLMQKKALQLAGASASEKKEHIYRYEANIGTFYVHRWIRHGADRTNMGDVELASRHIGEALKINPQAHFGRERYQLMAINWILHPPVAEPVTDVDRAAERRFFPTFLVPHIDLDPNSRIAGFSEEDQLELFLMERHGPQDMKDAGLDNAVEGLSGLIALGNAWESVDVFHALALALKMQGRLTIAYLGELRIEEIMHNGGHSLYPNSSLIKEMNMPFSHLGGGIPGDRKSSLQAQYKSLRSSAEKWQANRIAYMEERLRKGIHPDTDPDFWRDYKEIPHPSLYTWRDLFDPLKKWLVVSPLVLFLVWSIWRRRKKAARILDNQKKSLPETGGPPG